MDFKRNKFDVPATVLTIEYDPNRTCRIALIEYKDGEKSYILAPTGLQVGMKVESGQKVAPKVGNAMPLKNVPLGTSVHNIEIRPGSGGKVARAAGQHTIVSNREAGYALIKMPSGEIRRFNEDCYCTIGQVGNTQHMNEMSGKAGRTRWMGVRPTVRGMTMNPVDHPNGGGEGKSSPVAVASTSNLRGATSRARRPAVSASPATPSSYSAAMPSNQYIITLTRII